MQGKGSCHGDVIPKETIPNIIRNRVYIMVYKPSNIGALPWFHVFFSTTYYIYIYISLHYHCHAICLRHDASTPRLGLSEYAECKYITGACSQMSVFLPPFLMPGSSRKSASEFQPPSRSCWLSERSQLAPAISAFYPMYNISGGHFCNRTPKFDKHFSRGWVRLVGQASSESAWRAASL